MPLPRSFPQAFKAFRVWRQRQKIRRLFRREVGFEGDFENPETHWEKVQFRKLYGNHEFYGRLADKLLVRDYVRKRVGEEVLVPLLGVHDRLDETILDGLPGSFVIKVSNASGWNEIVRDKGKMDYRRTIRYFNRKVKRNFSRNCGEVHYDYSEPKILIESLLLAEDGELPWDLNFYCYNGSKGFDYCLHATSADRVFEGHFYRNETLIEGNLSSGMIETHLRAENFDRLLEIARELSGGIDFVRVDLYNFCGKIFFGEMTFTTSAGFKVYHNPALNELRDTIWELDRYNPMLYRDPAAVRAGR
jgi:hypothetical protein